MSQMISGRGASWAIRPRASAWRVRQFFASALRRPDTHVDERLRRLAGSEARWALLARLSPFDRVHHLRVWELLVAQGHTDADLLLAALLHDVGKADERGRAGAISRTLRVLGRRFLPGRGPIVGERHVRLLHGLYLAERHAALGAALARATGASERCCWLIERHEDAGASDDPLLADLIAADDAALG